MSEPTRSQAAQVSHRGPPTLRRTAGMSFTEILIAVIVMATAMLPVFAVLTSGVMRSDVSVTYEQAANLASSIMNTILSEEVTFQQMLDNMPTGTPFRHPGPSGAVHTNLMGDGGTAPNKFFQVGRNRYTTELYVNSYPSTGTTSLAFQYFANPAMYWEAVGGLDPHSLHRNVVLGDPTWSPYLANPTTTPERFMTGSARWATPPAIVIGAGNPALSSDPVQLLKIILIVRWGGDWATAGQADASRGGRKQFALVSWKARL